MNLVLFGAPGSGKGTQSAKLIDEFGLFHISTGEVLRDHIKRGTDLGKVAQEFISQGQLIPDELMISILDDVLEKDAKGKKGVIFDGFPRTIPQAEALKELWQSEARSFMPLSVLKCRRRNLWSVCSTVARRQGVLTTISTPSRNVLTFTTTRHPRSAITTITKGSISLSMEAA